MKNYSLAFLFLSVLFISFFSCKKINESTTLGGDLIPPVDNVNTFEVALNTVTDNALYNDSVKVGYSDPVALGDVNDPVFGNTHANLAFTITPSVLGFNPFDTLVSIDSVVLYMAYHSAWGDTITNGVQTLRVYEVAQGSAFNDSTIYRYNDPASDFAVTTPGALLGSTTYTIRNSIKTDTQWIRRKDTVGLAGVVRVKLDNNLGTRFAQYDTSSNPLKGGFHADNTNGQIFRNLFKGLAIKAENSGNALAYFSLSDMTKTKLTVYYKRKLNNDTLWSSFDFVHKTNGRANYVKHTPGAQWNQHLTNGNPSDSLLFIQTSPSGSYASIVIPGLSSFSNKVVHLAEVIATIPTPYRNSTYGPPSKLFLDRRKNDSTYMIFERDIPVNSLNGNLSLQTFGGNLRSDSYKFNITRYVQNIITSGATNDTLRLHAPFRTFLTVTSSRVFLPQTTFLDKIAGGRVVLGGGNYSDSLQRLRLRIVYSNL